MKQLKKIPRFKSETKERRFWQKADSTKYVDWAKAEKWIFPNVKLSSVPITIRISEAYLYKAKIKAHQKKIYPTSPCLSSIFTKV